MAFIFLRTIGKQDYLYKRVNKEGKRKDKLIGNFRELVKAVAVGHQLISKKASK